MTERTIREEFEELSKQFESETGSLSVSYVAMKKPSAKKIVELGESVLPLIVDKFRIENFHSSFWVHVFLEIVESEFIPKHHYGNINQMEQDCVYWYDNIYLI